MIRIPARKPQRVLGDELAQHRVIETRPVVIDVRAGQKIAALPAVGLLHALRDRDPAPKAVVVVAVGDIARGIRHQTDRTLAVGVEIELLARARRRIGIGRIDLHRQNLVVARPVHETRPEGLVGSHAAVHQRRVRPILIEIGVGAEGNADVRQPAEGVVDEVARPGTLQFVQPLAVAQGVVGPQEIDRRSVRLVHTAHQPAIGVPLVRVRRILERAVAVVDRDGGGQMRARQVVSYFDDLLAFQNASSGTPDFAEDTRELR